MSCANLPIERILLETDAPYMPVRGMDISTWLDLPIIYLTASRLRPGLGINNFNKIIAENYMKAFGKGLLK